MSDSVERRAAAGGPAHDHRALDGGDHERGYLVAAGPDAIAALTGTRIRRLPIIKTIRVY